MIILPNDCRCSGNDGCAKRKIAPSLPVFPKNWDSAEASTEMLWYIHYRFYDPNFADKYPKGKSVMVRGEVNRIKDIYKRQAAMCVLVKSELDRLKNMEYNPIRSSFVSEPEVYTDISPSSNF